MKASPQEQNELLRLQTADNSIQRLEHTLKNLPQIAELASLAPTMDAVRQRLAARNGEIEDAKTELRRVESDVEVVEARIGRDTDRVQQSSSMKDVQGLEAELTSLRKRRGDLEEIELTVMERIENLEASAAEIESERASLAAQIDELEAAREKESQALAAQRTALAKDRDTVSQRVSEELLALYEKQRARYGIGAALLQRGVSLGSNVTLTESDLAVIRRAAPDDVVLDPDSSCILIRNEESGL